MTCPTCGVSADPAVTVQGIAVCASCGMALLAEGDTWRQAKFVDLEPLTAAELLQLRKVSAPIARPGRKR